MKVAVLADIHSNLTAFKAVLDNCRESDDVEMIWCAGDIVGYGPDPAECIDAISETPYVCIAGNHDVCVAEGPDDSKYNLNALAACAWTRTKLDNEHISFLLDLPTDAEPADNILLVHGSPSSKLWEYVFSTWRADEILSETPYKLIFVGHSHVPLFFEKSTIEEAEFMQLITRESIKLDFSSNKYLINPGSVGQPRDGDARASYMLFDTDSETIEYRRVEYDVDETFNRIISEGLPVALAERLKLGL